MKTPPLIVYNFMRKAFTLIGPQPIVRSYGRISCGRSSVQVASGTDIQTVVESVFERANKFVLQRWTSKPGIVRDKRAFSRGHPDRLFVISILLILVPQRYCCTAEELY